MTENETPEQQLRYIAKITAGRTAGGFSWDEALEAAAAQLDQHRAELLPRELDPLLDALNALRVQMDQPADLKEILTATNKVARIFGQLPDALVGPKRNNHHRPPTSTCPVCEDREADATLDARRPKAGCLYEVRSIPAPEPEMVPHTESIGRVTTESPYPVTSYHGHADGGRWVLCDSVNADGEQNGWQNGWDRVNADSSGMVSCLPITDGDGQ